MGDNVNGPSLIRVPEWVQRPLGRYYLYFAHHQGRYIRLAYANELQGPWRTYQQGVLDLEESYCIEHIASPDVHIDPSSRQIRMYYHGPDAGGGQVTRLAISNDGLTFSASPLILGPAYFRVFGWNGLAYALAMPGQFFRSRLGLNNFQKGPSLFTRNMRHSAVMVRDDVLYVFYSNVGDAPEHILLSTIELSPDWMYWQASDPVSVLTPELDWEGVTLPIEPSIRGWAPGPVRQLRDPAVYQEDNRTYLLYSVAGEQGIAISEIFF